MVPTLGKNKQPNFTQSHRAIIVIYGRNVLNCDSKQKSTDQFVMFVEKKKNSKQFHMDSFLLVWQLFAISFKTKNSVE